jgi:DNA-directed RNA polymerase subunit RPC12/RpoP
VIVCSACGAEVLEGGLRCPECGAPFVGRDKRTRLRPSVKLGGGIQRSNEGDVEVRGTGLSFHFEPDTK